MCANVSSLSSSSQSSSQSFAASSSTTDPLICLAGRSSGTSKRANSSKLSSSSSYQVLHCFALSPSAILPAVYPVEAVPCRERSGFLWFRLQRFSTTAGDPMKYRNCSLRDRKSHV
eukprot:TRINITY_DN2576_c0_g1_i3.p2 TRINITY_DN2576_c0_g1~~TRINITY_DN2576_c0_g1_i3.p2  ORF type:complete len:116 (-),score=4.97 TRINITY_DN2576_c0_g1_i3:64-411(-)